MVTVNATLVVVVLLMLVMSIRGFKKGFVKELSGLIALVAAFFVVAMAILFFAGIQKGNVTNSVYSVIVLLIFGIVYGLIRLVVNAFKILSHLPVLNLADKMLGLAAGFCEAVILVWIVFMLCENHYLGPVSQYVQHDLAESDILQLVYQYNFLLR